MTVVRRAFLKGMAVLGSTAAIGRRVSASDLPHTIEIVGGSPTRNVNYTFEVSGQVALGPEANHEDRIEGGTVAKGIVAGAADSYTFSGQITSFWAGGDVTVRIDGEPVSDPVGLPASDPGLPHVVEFVGGPGVGRNTPARYEFAVSGELQAEKANPDDSIGRSAVDAYLLYGSDTYRFSGAIEYINVYQRTADVRIQMR